MRVRGFNLRRPGDRSVGRGNFGDAEVDSLVDDAMATPIPGDSNTPRQKNMKTSATDQSASFNMEHLPRASSTASSGKRKKKSRKKKKRKSGAGKGNKTESKIEKLRDQVEEKRNEMSKSGKVLHHVSLAKLGPISDKTKAEYSAAGHMDYTYKTDYQKRREFDGHAGKVLNVHWGSDSRHFVSISPAMGSAGRKATRESSFAGSRVSIRASKNIAQSIDLEKAGGQIIVWDGLEGQARTMIPAETPRLHDAQFSQSMNLIVSGGADDVCTVHSVRWDGGESLTAKKATLEDHEGTITSCIFLDDDNKVVSSSNDCTIIVWDVAKCMSTVRLMDHDSDVNSIHAYPGNRNMLVSASQDGYCKIWDVRQGKNAVQSFDCDEDVNSAKWFPDGKCILAALENNEVRMYDLRTSCVLGTYKRTGYQDAGAKNITPFPSGKFFACLYEIDESPYISVWDTMTGKVAQHLKGDQQVTCVEISPDGRALVAGSVNTVVSIWA